MTKIKDFASQDKNVSKFIFAIFAIAIFSFIFGRSIYAEFIRTSGPAGVDWGYGYGFGNGYGVNDGSYRSGDGNPPNQWLYGYGIGPLDVVPPSATTGGPADGQIGAPVDALIDRNFTENLDSASVNASNVLLRINTGNTQNGAPTGSNLCQSVFLSNNRIICSHAVLGPSAWHTFTITTGVTDKVYNALASNLAYRFQTASFGGGTASNPPPTITNTSPYPGGTLAANGKIVVNFSRLMRTSGEGSVVNISNIQLFLTANGAVTGSNLFTSTTGWTFDTATNQLKITPPTLTASSTYRLIVKADNNFNPGDGSCGGTGEPACVMSGDDLALQGMDYILDFTATQNDTVRPTLIGSYPDNNATGIDRAIYDLSVNFSEALDPATVSTATVLLLRDDGDSIAEPGNYNLVTDAGEDAIIATGLVRLESDGRMTHFSPNAILNASAKHFLLLRSGASGIKDLAGNSVLSDAVRTFTTSATVNGQASDTTAPSVIYANADNFGIAINLSEAMKFDVTANATRGSSSGANDVNNATLWTVETSPDGTNWGTVPLTDPSTGAMLSGKAIEYEPDTKTLFIDGLSMPPGQQFKVTGSTAIQDLAGNGLASDARTAQGGSIQNTSTTGGMLGGGMMTGGPNFFEMGMNPIAVFPKSAMAGATTRYRIEFSTSQAIPASGKITLAYPSGFNFAASCATFPTDTFENSDINGPATGVVTVSSIACNSVSRTITITLGSVATQVGDMVRFEIQGVVNSTVPKDFSTSGYTVDIKTYNASNTLLESKTSMPFFLSAPGANVIQGKVFVDADNDKTLDGGESGVDGSTNAIKVCMGGPMGFECQTINSTGDYSFATLPDGFYNINIPSISSGNFSGGPFFRDVNVTGGQTKTENFPLQQVSSANLLDVYISGGAGLANQKLDVFAFSSSVGMSGPASGPGPGGFAVRELTLNGSGIGTLQLPLSQGKWQVGVGPWMPKDPGSPPPPPDFTFMPPKPVEVEVGSSGVPDLCTTGAGAATSELCFTLTASSNQIKGKVVDGSGLAISNAFVMARPAFFDTSGPASAGVSQSDSNGLFNIKVVAGTYIVDANMPGMPPSNSFECTVKDNTSALDNNSTADVYCNGTLIVNDITGFSGSSITLGNVTNNDLILKIAKGDTSISGRVLDESGNAIAFAHVNGTEVDSSGNPIGGWADAPTDNSGNYTLYVAGGTGGATKNWKIRAFAPTYGELPSITVAVTSGQNLTGKNIQVSTSDFGTVTGAVTQASVAIQGVFVGIHGASGGNGTVSGADGTYTLKVRAGSGYTIEGFMPGQGPTTRITSATVTAGQTLSNQNLTMTQPGTIRVTISGVTDAFVDARDSSGRGNGTGSNSTAGVYDVIIPAGTYNVTAGNPNYGIIGSQSSVVVTGGQITSVTFTPPTLYIISGTISSSDSACLEGATVILTDKSNGRIILSQVNSSGAWSASASNGTYSVIVGKPGCVDNSDAGSVRVSSANVAASARTLVKADATISGRVWLDANSNSTLDTGENISFDTMVFVTSAGGRMIMAKVDTSQATTTSNNYSLALTAGTWTVTARSDGSQSSGVSVTVVSAGSASQNLQLSAISGYTRKEPRPYGIAPSQGGIVKNTDISSDFEVNIPAGVLGTSSNEGSVLTKETTAVINTASQNVVGGKGIEITPKDASGQPIKTVSSSNGSSVTITIPYDESQLPSGITEDKIIIGAWSDEKQQWEALSTTCDAANNKCTAITTHFSTFAPIVPTGGGTTTTTTTTTTTAGGGGAIIGGGGAAVAPTVPSQTKVAVAQVKVVLPSVAKALNISSVFSRNLKTGTVLSDVKRLQQLLNADPDTKVAESGLGSSGKETEYFGPATKEALKKFQKKYGIISSGDETATGYGALGPKTRAKLAEIFGEKAAVVSGVSAEKQAIIANIKSQIDGLQQQVLQLIQKLQKLLQEQLLKSN